MCWRDFLESGDQCVLRAAEISSSQEARTFLRDLLQIVEITPVSHNVVLEALTSESADLEDGIQHFAAIEARCDCIVTRNGGDYARAIIPVYSPKEFTVLFAS